MTDSIPTRKRCNFDYVFCIDTTARCYYYSINEDLAEAIYTMRERLEASYPDFEIGRIRVRFVFFSDILYEQDPLRETLFFDLDTEREEIGLVLNYEAGGGGDLPESGLEGLALALRSPFELVEGELNRHIVCLYTDATAHPLGKYTDYPCVPDGMPRSLDELRAIYETEMDGEARRLYLLAPAVEPWQEIAEWQGAYLYSEKSLPGELDGETLVDVVTSPKQNP